MHVASVVFTQKPAPERIDPGEPVVEFLATDIHDELPAPDRAHQAAGNGISLQNHRLDSRLGQRVAGRQPGGSGPEDQRLSGFSVHDQCNIEQRINSARSLSWNAPSDTALPYSD